MLRRLYFVYHFLKPITRIITDQEMDARRQRWKKYQ